MRENISKKKRVVVKIGTSSLTHETGAINLHKIKELAVELTDLRGQGMDVVLVSSGAIAVGAGVLGQDRRSLSMAGKQAAAAVGQAALMQIYEDFFSEYRQRIAQILLTKDITDTDQRRENAHNTFEQLLACGVIPIVNENDTIATDEIEFGDNDTLSAMVAELVGADLLILLSDIDGLYTADPNKDPGAEFISEVHDLTPEILGMGSGAVTAVGTGGMQTKLQAAGIARRAGTDMVIANGNRLANIHDIMTGEEIGTYFWAEGRSDD